VLELARNFSGNNTDWTPVIQAFAGVEMVLVPAGCFQMGSTDEQVEKAYQQCKAACEVGECERTWFEDEQPVHTVCFEEAFWIDQTEVTNAQFAAFNGQAAFMSNSHFSANEQPRVEISWDEAAVFCESRGARLPNEAEWEYAARGPDGLVYPWGNEFDCRLANTDDEIVRTSCVIEGGAGCDGFDSIAPVCSFPAGASWVDALDLSGNVFEWVADWYGAYTETAHVNPQGPASGEERVLRGGSWIGYDSDQFRAANRINWDPNFWGFIVGFRCARSR
jgi:formylglycine-generating enzyme required for sulfatase activity